MNGELSEVKNDLDKLNEEHDETERQVVFEYMASCKSISYFFDKPAYLTDVLCFSLFCLVFFCHSL